MIENDIPTETYATKSFIDPTLLQFQLTLPSVVFDNYKKDREIRKHKMGKVKNKCRTPLDHSSDSLPLTNIPSQPSVFIQSELQICCYEVAQLLRIFQCVHSLVKSVVCHFTVNGWTVFGSSEHNEVRISLVLARYFFNKYEFQTQPNNATQMPFPNIIKGSCSTKEIFTNILILKKQHNVANIFFDIVPEGIIIRARSKRGEYLQMRTVLFHPREVSQPEHITNDHKSDGENIDSFTQQTSSERLKAHCISAKMKGCKNLRFIHHRTSVCNSTDVIIEDADHPSLVPVTSSINSNSDGFNVGDSGIVKKIDNNNLNTSNSVNPLHTNSTNSTTGAMNECERTDTNTNSSSNSSNSTNLLKTEIKTNTGISKIEVVLPMKLILPVVKIHKISSTVHLKFETERPFGIEYPIHPQCSGSLENLTDAKTDSGSFNCSNPNPDEELKTASSLCVWFYNFINTDNRETMNKSTARKMPKKLLTDLKRGNKKKLAEQIAAQKRLQKERERQQRQERNLAKMEQLLQQKAEYKKQKMEKKMLEQKQKKEISRLIKEMKKDKLRQLALLQQINRQQQQQQQQHQDTSTTTEEMTHSSNNEGLLLSDNQTTESKSSISSSWVEPNSIHNTNESQPIQFCDLDMQQDGTIAQKTSIESRSHDLPPNPSCGTNKTKDECLVPDTKPIYSSNFTNIQMDTVHIVNSSGSNVLSRPIPNSAPCDILEPLSVIPTYQLHQLKPTKQNDQNSHQNNIVIPKKRGRKPGSKNRNNTKRNKELSFPQNSDLLLYPHSGCQNTVVTNHDKELPNSTILMTDNQTADNSNSFTNDELSFSSHTIAKPERKRRKTQETNKRKREREREEMEDSNIDWDLKSIELSNLFDIHNFQSIVDSSFP